MHETIVKCLGMSVAPSRKAEDVTVQLEKDTTGKVGKVHWVDWVGKTINVYESLSPEMKETLTFIKEHKSLIDELRKVMNCIEGILDRCKNDGLSKFTSLHCKYAASKELVTPRDATKRMQKVGCKIVAYFMQEEKLLESDTARHNISSDIIESIFGEYKDRKSPNKLCGVTSYVLVLPLFGCLKTREDRLSFDFKTKMEAVGLADIKEWKDLYLLDNWAQKRTETLGKAS